MLKQNNVVIVIAGSYGVSVGGLIYPGMCPDGVDGVNYPAGTGPLYTPEGRELLGVTEEADPDIPDSTYQFVNGDAATGYTVTPKPLSLIAEAKLASANGECDTLLAKVKSGYPPSEVESWSKQESEARAYAANNQAATPLLDALASQRGIEKADLVDRVIAKADAYAVAVGMVVGRRQAIEDVVTAALDDEDEEAGRAALIAIDPKADWPEL